MPYKRKKTRSLTLDEADGNKLEAFSERRHVSMKEIVSFYIQLDTDYDLWSTDWKDKVKEAEEKRDRYAGLKDACGNMTFAKKDYICVRAVLGKPPSIKKLSPVIEEAHKICAICEEDTRKKLDRDLTLEKVHELEAQLDAKTNEKFKVPVCNYDGHLTADGLSFEGCRIYRGKTLSIEKFCKVRMEGRPFSGYVERVIGVGKKV